jgi:hypothetical protein
MIILEKPDGSRRLVPPGPGLILEPGERPVGFERSGTELMSVNKKDGERLDRMIDEQSKLQGIGAGDVVAKLTKALNIPECASCKKRRLLYNRLRLIGWRLKWVDGEPRDITAESSAFEDSGALLEDKSKTENR